MTSSEHQGRQYPRPASTDRYVWLTAKGRMEDLETGEFATIHTLSTEYRKLQIRIHNADGGIARMFEIQLNLGDYRPRSPFPVSVFYQKEGSAAVGSSGDLSIERLAHFLAVWPELNQPATRDFVIVEQPARM